VELLVGTLARARQQRSPELVTLIGVPGIGKSRLVGELFGAIEQGGELTYWRQGRSLPYGEAVSYWALAEMVKAQAGILETDSDAEAEAKLARSVEQLIEEDADWVLSHLRPLVGQGSGAGSQEEAFAAWRRFFEALAEQRPLVLVFEDIQWADDGLLDFIEHLVDWVRDVPLLILCTARLELLERRPAWGGGKINAATVALSPLTDEDTAKLIWALGAETPQDLLERCGGNPLYAEQYVRMLAERGSSEALPETVQGIIAARLDSLAAEEKALLQNAAVIGKVFWLGALDATEQQLHPLQQKEFVGRARRSSVDGETEYAFKHLLVRDVAYGQVPRAERAGKHLRVAEWIESLGRAEDHAEMLAHHYASALALMRAASQDIDGVGARARAVFRDAGSRALTLNALAAAERYFSDALELTPADDPERTEVLYDLGRTRFLHLEEGWDELEAARDGFVASGKTERAAEADLLLAQVAWRRGESDVVRRHLAQARELAGSGRTRIRAAVLTEVSRYAMLAGHTDESVNVGTEAIELAEELGLDELRAQALNNVGSALGNAGVRGGMPELEESIAIATRINAIGEVIRALNNKAAQQVIYAQLAEGRETVGQLRALAERYGYLGFVRFIDGGPEIAHRYQDAEWDDALAVADRFLGEVEAGSPHYQAGGAYSFRGLMRLARDDEAGALSDAARGIELGERAGDPQARMSSLALGGLVYDGVGDRARVAEIADELLREIGSEPDLGWSVVVATEIAWVVRAAGRAADFRALLETQPPFTPWLDVARAIVDGDLRGAADILADLGAQPMEAFCRLRVAEELVAEGRRAEADDQLRPALAFYRGVGATRYVREGEALFAASA